MAVRREKEGREYSFVVGVKRLVKLRKIMEINYLPI